MVYKMATLFLILHITVLARAMIVSPVATMPEVCAKQNKTFCFIKSKDYPQKLIDYIVMKDHLIPTRHEPQSRSEEAYNDDCDFQRTFKPIYEIVDENDNVRYVIQTSEMNYTPKTLMKKMNFQQIVGIEECKNKGIMKGSSIFANTQSMSLKRYQLSCEETYLDYSFLALTLDRKGAELVKAKGGIPVSCACRVKERSCM